MVSFSLAPDHRHICNDAHTCSRSTTWAHKQKRMVCPQVYATVAIQFLDATLECEEQGWTARDASTSVKDVSDTVQVSSVRSNLS